MKKKFNLKEKIKSGSLESEKLLENKNNNIGKLFERFEDLKAISYINHAVNTGISLKETIKMFTELTKRIFSSNGATVYLLSSDKKSLIMQNYTTPRNVLRKIESLAGIKIREVKIPLARKGFYPRALERKKSLILSSPEDIKKSILEFTEDLKDKSEILYKSIKKLVPMIYRILGINSVMIVPLIADNKSIGIIDIGSKKLYKKSDLDRMMTISREITAVIKRKLMEDEINHTNKELKILLEMNAEGVRFIDKDFNVIKVNKKFCEITRIDEKKNLARKCYSVFHIPDCNKPTCTLKQILDGARKVRKEVNVVRIDKKIVPCIITAIPMKDADGNTIGVVENFNDISEVREAEKSMLESKNKYRKLAETLDEMIIDLDLKGNITYANKEVFDKTGYTKKDLNKGFNIMQVMGLTDKVKVAVNFIRFLKVKKARKTSVYKIKRKDGTTFRAVAHPNYLLDGKGKITAIRVVLVDLSDIEIAEKKSRESEEKYRLLFENSLDGVYRTTLEGKYIDVNPALVKMLGSGTGTEKQDI